MESSNHKKNFLENKILFKNVELCPGQSIIEIFPPLYGCKGIVAFRAKEVQILTRTLEDNTVPNRIEICDIRVMGSPQLTEYTGSENHEVRGLTSFFEQRTPITWSIFFSKKDAGLQFIFNNLHSYNVKIYIALYGNWAEVDERMFR